MANQIDRLEIQVQTQAQKANTELDKLAGKLDRISSSLFRLNASGLKGLANGVQSLSSAMQGINNVKTTDFTRLAKNIEKLGNINQAKLNATASAIRTISSALTASAGLSTGAVQITEFANSISKLGYKSAANAITNIPLMANALQGLMRTLSTSPQISRNLIDMTNAIGNLAAQGSKVRSATNSINASFKSYATSTKQATNSTRAFTFSLASLYAKLWAIRRIFKTLWSSIETSMDYVETINLFQTSFKKIGVDAATKLGMEMGSVASETYAKGFIDRAAAFNKKITEALSLDPDLMMNYQAVFAQMANSMNLTAETAMNISESFTLLGNDIASLWNIETDAAMKKLQSGLAGQIRPLRELGVDISKTSLEMYALKYGITDSIEKMSQAAKVQLRWLAIMEQTEVAFGDMAKTMQSPANQLRILQQQWKNLSRAIGNIFLPVVTTVLPYINALVIVLRRMLDTIATAVGFELPDYSDTNIYKDVTDSIEEIGEEAGETTESVEKLRKALMRFDEINILSAGSGKSSSKIGVDIGSGYKELDDAINQKTASYMEKFNEELAKMQNKAEELADKIQPKIEKFIETINKIKPALAGLAAAFAAYKITSLFKGLGASLLELGPKGLAVVAIIGGLAAVYTAIRDHNKKLREEDLAKRFGEISLSMEEIEDIARRLTENDYTAKIDIYISEQHKLKDIEEDIAKDIDTLNKLNWKISVGLALTEGEVAQYKSTIESFISNAEAYIEQQHYVTHLAIEAVIQDENFKAEMSEIADRVFKGSKGEMERLGKDLRAEMDNALADGIIDANEQKVINNLLKEINEIQSRISDAEFIAKIQTIEFQGDLTADSYKKLFTEIQEAIDERQKALEQGAQQALIVARTQYEIDMKDATTEAQKRKIKKEYDNRVKEIQKNLSESKIIISQMGMEFAYEKIKEKWAPEFERFEKSTSNLVETSLQDAIQEGTLGVDPQSDFQSLLQRMRKGFESAYYESGMTKAAKKNLEDFLSYLKPTAEQNKELADEYIKSGKMLPETLSKQLTDEAMLKALAGDIDGIYYVMGQQVAESPEMLKMLKNGELKASKLDDSFIRGLKSKLPELKKQGENLIIQTDKAIASAVNKTGKKNMQTYAKDMIGGFNNTFDKDKTSKSSVKKWLENASAQIRNWKLPTLKVGIDIDDSALRAYTPKYPTVVTPQLKADGGFVNTGEMFIAREAGPEMVGRIGSRTAVANNDQITQGIASAVESAMVNVLVPALASMGSGGNGVIDNRIYLDSNVLYEAMEKVRYRKERQSQTLR